MFYILTVVRKWPFDSNTIYMELTDQITIISLWRSIKFMRHIARVYSSLVVYKFLASQRTFNRSYDDYKKCIFIVPIGKIFNMWDIPVLIINQSYIKGVINNLHTCIHYLICLTPPYTPPKFSHPFLIDHQEKCLQFCRRGWYQIEICTPTIK